MRCLHWVKAPAAGPDDISSVPQIHMMKGENPRAQKLTSDLHKYTMTQTTRHIHMNISKENNKEEIKFLKVVILKIVLHFDLTCTYIHIDLY